MRLASITYREPEGAARQNEPVGIGVPLPAGVVRNTDDLRLVRGDQLLAADFQALQHWPDGSVRWCFVDALLEVDGLGAGTVELWLGQPVLPLTPGVRVKDGQTGEYSVETGHVSFQVKAGEVAVSRAGMSAALRQPVLLLEEGAASFRVEQAHWSAESRQVKLTFCQNGVYENTDGELLCRFESELTFYAGSGRVHWQFTLHNPRAARHPGGLWDLGDEASLMFKGLEVPISLPADGESWLQPEAKTEWLQIAGSARLFQASSGGEHWNSRSHLDKHGQIPLEFSGYQLHLGKDFRTGRRASPLLCHGSGFAFYVDRFWQNFPKSIELNSGVARWGVFPAECAYQHELQPGERKTHRVRMDFATSESACGELRAPLLVGLTPVDVADSGAVQHFTPQSEPLDALIEIGLNARHGFLAKREIIDEYGWRNFGDIFADHESLYLPEGALYVSHYNNQYDPLYGFLRQYLRTGDATWMTMANELAWHVGDIDIYSTQNDRDEYNGGLFWHTDHYVDACTASHRTYSRHQKPNGEAVTEGGGPGAEHCYTHGLALHYCLTGCERSRQAVLQLTNWITHFYEGSGTVLEVLLDAKNRILPRLRYAPDQARILDHRYPLNRGVGNYLNALLDSLAITGDLEYLRRAERVICGTFSPADDIADRRLDDVETTWFYTIFLQSVARFIEVKKQYGEQSSDTFGIALAAFMKYARWIAEHDQPYLNRPDILEFPNDTWAAQDVRKAAILYYANSYEIEPDSRRLLKEKADHFYRYVCNVLTESPTRHYSRILAILMQNHGVQGYFDSRDEAGISQGNVIALNPYRSRNQIVVGMLRDIVKTLFRFSLKRELRWLRHRHEAGARLYARLYGQPSSKG